MGYPATVTLGNLTETHSTAQHPLGAVGVFTQAGGQVLARYMQNAYTAGGGAFPGGLVVNYAHHQGNFDSQQLADTRSLKDFMAGIVPVERTSGDFGWVVFRGPLTAGQFQLAAGITASSSLARLARPDFQARLITQTHLYSQSDGGAGGGKVIGMLRSTGTTLGTGTSSTGIFDVLWR